MATYSLKLPTKNVAKLLQMETWLLLKVYRKSPVPYPIVALPTHYDLLFNHNPQYHMTGKP